MLNHIVKYDGRIRLRKRSNKGLSADKCLALYFRDLSEIPLLSRLEEMDLGRRARAGDHDALQKLVTGNLRFVVRIAKKYRRFGVSFLDLINQGNLGLIQAAHRFDPEKQIRFTTYAVWWIRQLILEYLTKSAFTLSLPSGSLATLKRATLMSNNMEVSGASADTQAFTRDAGISEKRFRNVLIATSTPLSFEQAAGEKNEIAIGDILRQSTFRSADEEFAQSKVALSIRKSVQTLTPVQRQVLGLRFGLEGDGPFTLLEIGRRINLSKERVRQIVNAAMDKLRESNEIRSLRSYIDRAA